MKRTAFLVNVFMLIILATLTSGCFGPSFHGEVLNPADPAAEFSGTDQNGNVFDLNNEQGKVVLVFFGFLNCTDECPLTMAHLSQAMVALGDSAKNVQVVMITTDPVRDTPQAMQAYLSKFNPTFLGITGAAEQLKPIWADYGVTVLDGGETHSSYTYVIDQAGKLRLLFDPEMAPEDIAADLSTLLKTQ